MSARVSGEVWQSSQADGTALLVLLALADQAGDDGVTWLQIESSQGKKSITAKARCSRATATRAVKWLVDTGELQVVKVRRGTSFINVYRVVVGRIASVSVDYDRLPFALPHRFGAQAQFEPVGTGSSETVHGLKFDSAGAHSELSDLLLDFDPSLDTSDVQESTQKSGGEEELPEPLRTTLSKLVPFIERAAGEGLDRVEVGRRHLHGLRAKPFTRGERQALLGHLDRLRGETARQAYERWITEKGADEDFPLEEIEQVVATWDDLDDVDRQELLDRAARLRAAIHATGEKAAA